MTASSKYVWELPYRWGFKIFIYPPVRPLTLNQCSYPVGTTLLFLPVRVVEGNIVSHGRYWEVCVEFRYVYQSCVTDVPFSSLRPGEAYSR